MSDDDVCYCGHIRDEHHDNDPEMGNECAVVDCDCIYFEEE